MFKHSRHDAILAGITVLQAALSFLIATTWSSRTTLELVALFPLSVLLCWFNPIISTHNFLHTPFFRSRRLNRVYAAFNSINLGLPQILYRFHHLNHHAHVNDRQGPDGRTKDLGSTYAYGRNGQHEHVLAYCALALFRPGTTEAWKTAMRKGQASQLAFELTACIAGIAALAWLSPVFVLVYWLPAFYLGWFLAHLENYYEHVGADGRSRFSNSVSYYGRLYNLLLCNEGYHQEHHLRPQAHWSARPAVRAELAASLDKSGRTIATRPPVLGFLEPRRVRAIDPCPVDTRTGLPEAHTWAD